MNLLKLYDTSTTDDVTILKQGKLCHGIRCKIGFQCTFHANFRCRRHYPLIYAWGNKLEL